MYDNFDSYADVVCTLEGIKLKMVPIIIGILIGTTSILGILKSNMKYFSHTLKCFIVASLK